MLKSLIIVIGIKTFHTNSRIEVHVREHVSLIPEFGCPSPPQNRPVLSSFSVPSSYSSFLLHAMPFSFSLVHLLPLPLQMGLTLLTPATAPCFDNTLLLQLCPKTSRQSFLLQPFRSSTPCNSFLSPKLLHYLP